MAVQRGARARATEEKAEGEGCGAVPDVLAVSTARAAAMIGVSAGTLANWRSDPRGRRGPRFARVGSHVVYPVWELERYLAEHIVDGGR